MILKEEHMKGNLEKKKTDYKLNDRVFVKAAAATIGEPAGEVTAETMKFIDVLSNEESSSKESRLISSNCRANCFQSCHLYAHVKDGKLVKTTPAPYEDSIYTGSCIKGVTNVQRTYSATRIKYPMRRVGERGEGKWERISWDEAINEISQRFINIQEKYGSRALAFDTASGNYGLVHGMQGLVNRLANSIGATKINVCYDQATGYGADRVIGGGVWRWGNEPRTMFDAKNIIVWGSNPVFSQPHNWRIVKEAQAKGAKVTTIDPIYSATASKSDEYIRIVPGTDLMLVLAMINYMIENELMDFDFLQKRTTAPFLIRRDNGKILRKSDIDKSIDPKQNRKDDDFIIWDLDKNEYAFLADGLEPKNIAIEGTYTVAGIEVDTVFTVLKNEMKQYSLKRANELTGISEEKIVDLVKTYLDGPTTIYTNYGIDHYQNGHLWAVAAFIMAAITGNIGKPGAGFTGLYVQSIPLNYYGLYVTNRKTANRNVPQTEFYKVMRDGELSGEPYTIKALFSTCANSISNFGNQNVWFDHILPNLEFIVSVDTELTDSSIYADIVLPAAFWFEVNDLRVGYNNPYIIFHEKAIEPLFESMPDADIIAMIGRKMGLAEFFPEDYDDRKWIEVLLDSDRLRKMNITFERLQKEKVIRGEGSAEKPYIRGEKRFETESGRANLYCESPKPRVDYGQDLTGIIEKERLPYFKPPGEAWSENPLFKKYPLVYLQERSPYRVHSQWFNVGFLRKRDPEPVVKLNQQDAEARGIKDGDIVQVFNDRGKVKIKAQIDDQIGPGVLSIAKGWQREQFIEGGYQELTSSETDPMAVNFPFFDCLVDVKKI